MKNIVFAIGLVSAACLHGAKIDYGPHPPNYDLAKIPAYTLEDPLAFADGTPVKDPSQWPARRREILNIFASEMYGREPPKPETLITDVVDERQTCAGYVTRKLVKMYFRADRTGPCINWIVFAPRYAKKPSPVIIWLNYKGNATLVPDKDIPPMTAWSRNGKNVINHRVDTEKIRGEMADPNTTSTVFPIGEIITRGYAVMSACYCEVSPDPHPDYENTEPEFAQEPFAYTGVFELWGKRDANKTDNPTALGAWAWALSRGLDYAERDPLLDAKRAVVTGCSRLGKAALLAGARDERFAVCVPNQTGGGGAPLAKRDYGENTSTMNTMFKHWYCKAYRKYMLEPWKCMPFDQHLLLAAVAPRPLMIQSEADSRWMHPVGEFLACKAARKVWSFLGKGTMPDIYLPECFSEAGIGESFAYVSRHGDHGIAYHDWKWMMDFADRAFTEP